VPSFDERLPRIHPEDRTRWQATIEQAIREKSDYELDTRLLLPSGITRHLHTIGHAVLDAPGDVVEFIGTVTDITERKQAEEALRRSEDHLRETRFKLARASRIATVAELSASIAHELNQPLTSVVANAQAARRWLLGNPPNFPEAVLSIERVLRDGRTADERMQHIRALFKRESFEKKEAKISVLVYEAIRLVREDSNKAEVPIDLQFDDELPAILVDPIQIQEVPINLVSNGIEAMENNIRPPRLTIKADLVDEGEALIEVMDNGPGLDDAEKIFDAFITTKEKGMGIGLAVSRSIIEAHDGQLWAENNPDYGAKFIVKLPSAGRRMGR